MVFARAVRAAVARGVVVFVVGALLIGTVVPTAPLRAQTVILEGPPGSALPTATPAFQFTAIGFGSSRPLRVTVQLSTSVDFSGALLLDSTFVSNDTTFTVQITRVLPSEAQVFSRARVQAPNGSLIDSPITGPRVVPRWLTLVSPNSTTGNTVDERRPLFVWKSARITPLAGVWKYEIEITGRGGGTEQGATDLSDTTWRAVSDLQTNTSYGWRVRATLRDGQSIVVNSNATFLVRDQAFPAKTLMYQNFPNPFPSPTSFSTCIWFDVAVPGARITLDVTDLRGNLVRSLIPGTDGQRDFLPGRYGQGLPGAGSNCDNRFVWDGTGNDGRTVAAGVYLLRFQAGRQPPSFRRVLFKGR